MILIPNSIVKGTAGAKMSRTMVCAMISFFYHYTSIPLFRLSTAKRFHSRKVTSALFCEAFMLLKLVVKTLLVTYERGGRCICISCERLLPFKMFKQRMPIFRFFLCDFFALCDTRSFLFVLEMLLFGVAGL